MSFRAVAKLHGKPNDTEFIDVEEGEFVKYDWGSVYLTSGAVETITVNPEKKK
jgi:hypothetical protein